VASTACNRSLRIVSSPLRVSAAVRQAEARCNQGSPCLPFDGRRGFVLFFEGALMLGRSSQMRSVPDSPRERSKFLLVVLLAVVAATGTVTADLVRHHNGRTVEGKVLSVDADWVVVQSGGNRLRIAREEVASIDFSQSTPPPVRVEIRNVKSDDSIDILLEDEVVVRGARDGGSWIDLTPDLKNGNNQVRFRIHNDRGPWAYRVSIRINGKVTTLKCGNPPRIDSPCRCCGKEGFETGVIDDLPPFWIYFDRELGEAEIIE
jgi:hypothetical protein